MLQTSVICAVCNHAFLADEPAIVARKTAWMIEGNTKHLDTDWPLLCERCWAPEHKDRWFIRSCDRCERPLWSVRGGLPNGERRQEIRYRQDGKIHRVTYLIGENDARWTQRVFCRRKEHKNGRCVMSGDWRSSRIGHAILAALIVVV